MKFPHKFGLGLRKRSKHSTTNRREELKRRRGHRARLSLLENLEQRRLLAVITNFEELAPQGSLIFDAPAVQSDIAVGGEIDSHTVSLDSGQTFSISLTGMAGLQGTIEVRDPSDTVLATQSAAAAGDDVVFQNISTGAHFAGSPGTYTINVAGEGGTTGAYVFEVMLNASLEEEEFGGAMNDSIATAQDINPSIVTLVGGIAERGGVAGMAQSATSDVYEFTAIGGQSHSLSVSGNVTLSLQDGSGNLIATGVTASNASQVISNFRPSANASFFAVIESVTDDEDYNLVVTRQSIFDAEPNDSSATAQDITVAVESIGHVSDGVDVDRYAVNLNAGDSLLAQTRTPFDGPLAPVNNLDPTIEIFDPTGASVAFDDNGLPSDGRNAVASHTALQTGRYTIEVAATAGTSGNYLLDVFGQSGNDPAPTVISSTPSDGDGLIVYPTTYEVDFSEHVNLDTLDFASATIAGLPATGFTAIDGDTIALQIDPATFAGVQSYDVTLPAGLVDDLQGNPSEAFNATFFFDPTVTIEGINFEDVNANGFRDPGEPGLAGVRMFVDENTNGTFDPSEPSDITASDGTYTIMGDLGTSFTVREVLPAGFRQTTPGSVDVLATSPAPITLPDFGNTWDAGYDLGDAANIYNTLVVSNGPFHRIDPSVTLGSIDAEPDGQPSFFADGDDFNGADDEDGVTFTSIFTPGEDATFDVQTSGPGELAVWLDSNLNGILEAGERESYSIAAAGVHSLTYSVPATAFLGFSLARFRFASDVADVASPNGRATSGEVEDYEVLIEANVIDFGDAPATYPTELQNNGARHVAVGPALGTRDVEISGQSDLNALGDDNNGVDDEDGVVNFETRDFTTPTLVWPGFVSSPLGNNVGEFTVDLQNPDPVTNLLNVWVDWNRDGTWDSSEHAIDNLNLNSAAGPRTVSFDIPQDLGANVVQGVSYARFRLSTTSLTSTDFVGPAFDGEVEDHEVLINEPPTVVSTNPIDGQTIGTFPTTFTVDFSEAIDPDND